LAEILNRTSGNEAALFFLPYRVQRIAFHRRSTGSVGTSRFYFSQLFHNLLHAFCVEFVIVLADTPALYGFFSLFAK